MYKRLDYIFPLFCTCLIIEQVKQITLHVPSCFIASLWYRNAWSRLKRATNSIKHVQLFRLKSPKKITCLIVPKKKKCTSLSTCNNNYFFCIFFLPFPVALINNMRQVRWSVSFVHSSTSIMVLHLPFWIVLFPIGRCGKIFPRIHGNTRWKQSCVCTH